MARRPDYARHGVELHLADCRDVLPSIKARADLVIADPPYSVTSLAWDRYVEGWVEAAGQCLRDCGSIWVFGSFRAWLRVGREFAGWRFAQDVVWEKHNGSSFHNDRFRRVHELVAQFYRGPWRDVYKSPLFTLDATKPTVRRKRPPAHLRPVGGFEYQSVDGGPRLMRSVIRQRSTHRQAIHPTQKPAGLIRHLVEYSCPPGGLVVSPFVGSGTDAIASLPDRRFIGCETDPAFFARAVERIEAHLDA